MLIEKVSNENCEFFLTHDKVERQVGLNDILHYVDFNRVDKKFKTLVKENKQAGNIIIDENTFCTLEPVDTRSW